MGEAALRPARAADAAAVADIYNAYVLGALSTFEEAAVSAEEMARRMKEVAAAGLPWLVAEDGGKVLGYSYANIWKARSAYRYSVESSIYLAESARGTGLGKRLYGALLAELRTRPIRMVIAGVALPNDASVALHESFGYRKTAHFERIGYKFGKYVDVTYWQLELEGGPKDEDRASRR